MLVDRVILDEDQELRSFVSIARLFDSLKGKRKGVFCTPVPKCDAKGVDLAAIQSAFSAIN